ncbi:MAG: ABC transporter ATP-binding protein [Patescibacteria group bacterium]
MENVLNVSNLKKSYGQSEAVSGISFEMKKGEIFALIGPNGAGKSTTLKMIAGLLSPTEGNIEINNLDIQKDSDKIREIITYLPEDSGAYKNLTGLEYLIFMAELYAKNKSEVEEFVSKGKEISGLGEKLKNKTSTYSKGMTRKLLLGRTVMSKPELAILDEPTSGLDVINAMEIRKTIKDMTKEGMSVLLSSHNMLEIEFLSNRVAIIDKGKIHEIGTPAELKKKYSAENLEEVFEKAVNADKKEMETK